MYLPWNSENREHFDFLLTNHNNDQDKQADLKMTI